MHRDLTSQPSEEHFRLFVENSSDMFVRHAKGGNILFVSPACQTLLGYEPEEMLGQSPLAFTHPDDVAQVTQVLEQISRQPGVYKATHRVRRKDGRWLWVEVHSHGVWEPETGDLREFTAAVRDVTEQRQMQETLQASEERYRSLIAALSEGIVLHDATGKIVAWNASAERILGLSGDQLAGRESIDPCWQAIHEDGSPFPGHEHPAMATLHTGTPHHDVVMGIHRQDGTTRWIEINSQPIVHMPQHPPYAAVASFSDITARKQTEESLRESEARFRDLFERASDAIATIAVDGTISSVNRAGEILSGRTRQDLVGQHVRRFLLGDPRAILPESESPLRTGEVFKEAYETEVLRPDGSRLPIEIHSRLLHDDRGKPIETLAIGRDISARKALEAQRAEFLAMLAHDIKNPLGVVLGYADILLENATEQGSMDDAKMLQRLRMYAEIIHSLISNYLDFSRVEAGTSILTRQSLSLNELVERIYASHRSEAQMQRIALTLALPKQDLVIEGDQHSLTRVFSNLLHNALKFTPELGKVALSVQQTDREAVIAIIDSGPGLAPEEIPMIFQKYTRSATHRQRGMGLGLYIVKTFVEAHGGRVDVKSTLGHGARFSVHLPLASAPVAEA